MSIDKITGFENKDLPVLNEQLRKTDADLTTAKTDIDTAEADIDALDVRITTLEGASVSSEKLVKAWVNFNGTGTPAITDSYNVSGTITDNGTGDYTINWDTDFANDDYAVAGMAEEDAVIGWVFVTGKTGARAVGSVRITIINDAGTQKDSAVISLMAIGNQ
jgi:hypothetical protein